MATFILSYPGTSWAPAGTAGAGQAYTAFGQWLTLCDTLTRLGARILVLDPAAGADVADGAKTGSVSASCLGAVFTNPPSGEGPVFLRARGDAEPVPTEQDAVCRALADAGLQTRNSRGRFLGQGDVIALDRNRFILTYGADGTPGTTRKDSLGDVKQLLPMGAQVLEVEMQPTHPVGISGIGRLTIPGADVLLVHRGALRSHTPEDIGKFAGPKTEVMVLGGEDAAAHATESVLVKKAVVLPAGCSTILRGNLARRGFIVTDVDVSALFGKAGGGPRRLLLDLPGLVLSEEAPSYGARREELHLLRASYTAA